MPSERARAVCKRLADEANQAFCEVFPSTDRTVIYDRVAAAGVAEAVETLIFISECEYMPCDCAAMARHALAALEGTRKDGDA
jgi:hypothetical protein